MARSIKPKTGALQSREAPKSTSSKTFKLIGTAVLLLSFVAQWTLLRYADQKQKQWDSALAEYRNAYSDGLLHVLLFFSEGGQATGTLHGQILTLAARTNAIGFSSRLSVANLAQDRRVELIKQVLDQSNQVSDFDSYNSYISYINKIEPDIQSHTKAEIENLNTLTSTSLWIFCALYIMGTAFQLLGIYREQK